MQKVSNKLVYLWFSILTTSCFIKGGGDCVQLLEFKKNINSCSSVFIDKFPEEIYLDGKECFVRAVTNPWHAKKLEELKEKYIGQKKAIKENPSEKTEKKLLEKNILAASISLILKKKEDENLQFVEIDIPMFFVSGWKQPPSSNLVTADQSSLSQDQIKVKPKRKSINKNLATTLSKDRSARLIDIHNHADLRFCCSNFSGERREMLESHKDNLISTIESAISCNRFEQQHLSDANNLVQQISSTMQRFIDKETVPIDEVHGVLDSEQVMFAYLTQEEKVLHLLRDHHQRDNLMTLIRNGYSVASIILDVSSRRDTCLHCSTFYKLHEICEKISYNISLCIMKLLDENISEIDKTLAPPLHIFISSSKRAKVGEEDNNSECLYNEHNFAVRQDKVMHKLRTKWRCHE